MISVNESRNAYNKASNSIYDVFFIIMYNIIIKKTLSKMEFCSV